MPAGTKTHIQISPPLDRVCAQGAVGLSGTACPNESPFFTSQIENTIRKRYMCSVYHIWQMTAITYIFELPDLSDAEPRTYQGHVLITFLGTAECAKCLNKPFQGITRRVWMWPLRPSWQFLLDSHVFQYLLQAASNKTAQKLLKTVAPPNH